MKFRLAILFISIALIIDVGKRFGIIWPTLMHNYINDVLYIPIVAFLIQKVIQIMQSKPKFRLSWYHLLYLVIFNSLYFEWYLPQINARYTADLFDVLAYTLGALIFWLINFEKIQVCFKK
jgi:hypothetical protein